MSNIIICTARLVTRFSNGSPLAINNYNCRETLNTKLLCKRLIIKFGLI